MNLRQAAQRALKAMEDGEYRADMIEFSDALIALRAALAEPEQEPVAWMSQGGDVARSKRYLEKMGFSNLIPLYTAPTPQPDTDCHAQGVCQRSGYSITPAPQRKPLTDERIDFIADTVVKGMPEGIGGFCKSWGWRQFARAILQDCAGHYAAPTPRKPLTAEEIVDIWAGVSMGYDDEINIIELARAIERKHGIGEQT